MPPLIYKPPKGLAERSYLYDYRCYVNKQYGLSLQTYDDLHEFSVHRSNNFWTSLWNYLPVKASKQPIQAVDESIPIDEFPQFHNRVQLNYAENLFSQIGGTVAVNAISEENLHMPEEVS